MSAKDLIISLPHPHLRAPSRRVTAINPEVKKLIDEMIAAALDWEDHRQHEIGVALAAIQIDQPYRIIVIRNNFDDKKDRSFSVFINPEITKREGPIEDDYEGCLSVPDIYGLVPRQAKVRVRALNELGQPMRVKAEGFLARVLQHEIDHLKGVMFVDHIKDQPQAFYKLTKDGKLAKLNYDKIAKADFFR